MLSRAHIREAETLRSIGGHPGWKDLLLWAGPIAVSPAALAIGEAVVICFISSSVPLTHPHYPSPSIHVQAMALPFHPPTHFIFVLPLLSLTLSLLCLPLVILTKQPHTGEDHKLFSNQGKFLCINNRKAFPFHGNTVLLSESVRHPQHVSQRLLLPLGW